MTGAVVIHGPMRTGKTFHRDAFAAHFGCDRIIEIDFEVHRTDEIGPGALVLTNQWPRKIDGRRRSDPIADRLDGARVYSIEQAREAIGVGPVSSIPEPQARHRGAAACVPMKPEPIAAALAKAGVILPLRVCTEYVGSVLDGHGDEVFVVDQHSELSDGQVRAIAAALVNAVNAVAAIQEALA